MNSALDIGRRSRPSRHALLGVGVAVSAAIVLTACTDAPPQSTRTNEIHVTRRDSAGIEIVTSSAPAWTPESAWRLADTPTLEIPSLDSRETRHFFSVSAAHRYADGRLVVSDGRAKQLRFYSPSGKFQHAGDRPAGPGKFATIVGFVVGPGDSLVVYDLHNNATILAPDGLYVRRLQLPSGYALIELLAWPETGAFVGRGLEMYGRDISTGESLREIDLFGFAEISPQDAKLKPAAIRIATYKGIANRVVEIDSLRVGIVLPFTSNPSLVARGGRVYAAPGPTAEVHVRRLAGAAPEKIESIFRFRGPRRKATKELLETQLKEEDLHPVDPRWAHWRRATQVALRAAPLPDSVFSVSGITLDKLGNLWLGHLQPEEDEWTVLSPDGVWLGTVQIPDRMRPLEIGDDWILVRTGRGNFEEHSVRLYELRKPE